MWCGDKGLSAKWKDKDEDIDQSWKRQQKTLIPQGQAQTPEDIGDLAVYLAAAPHMLLVKL
jgi:meso-butanediol dehydrogenase/(S,S)-butanediol dehydrogenase/diacetyl reductase